MPSIFDPTDPIGSYVNSTPEFQVEIEPTQGLDATLEPIADEAEARRTFHFPLLMIVVIFFILSIRLVNLQVTQGQIFQGLAQGNRIETRLIQPPRGAIIDRTGAVLAQNTPVYNLEVLPAQLPKIKEARELIYQQINQVTSIPIEEITDAIEKEGLRSLEPVTLKANLDRDTALIWEVKLGTVSGLSIGQSPSRHYEPLPGLSHILGYVGKVTKEELNQRPDLRLTSRVGKAGLEVSYDNFLQGSDGKEQIEVDSKGQIQRVVASEPAQPGKTLELHLDKELQQVMADALQEGVTKAERTRGVVIAMDPQNGGILGMVSLPSYDNNLFSQPEKKSERQALFDNKDQPLFNRAISGTYAPGSTSKPIWALAGLEEKIITENTSIQTPAEIVIGDSHFPDWKPHGWADVKKAIAESNNIFFYALGGGYDKIKGLGPNKLKEYANRFTWGKLTGIDLPGETVGLVPDPEWKKAKKKEPWYIGDTYHMAIGQGDVLVTPIQLATAINALANGGTVYEPHVVKTIKDLNDVTIEAVEPKVLEKQVGSPANVQIVRAGMRQTVLDGTARPLNEISMPIAGKTGTAQFEEKGKTHAWFVGFAPYDKPTISLVVMVEGGGESFTVAVPIAKKILSWYSENAQKFQPKTGE